MADLARGAGLPRRLTSFLGRDRELDELALLLAANRLITVTGAGGSGKSSLAVELARRVAAGFPDGVWFTSLEAVADPAQVAPTIAADLGLLASAERPLIEEIAGFLADRSALLIIDNLEHLLPAAVQIAELLHGTSNLRIVVTSRAALRISGEQEYPLAPLRLPGEDRPMPGVANAAELATELLAEPAIQLFVERAKQVRPAFEASAANVDVIIEICRRVDGLPLGIELAASRVGNLPLEALRERLAQRLDLPGSDLRDVPARQRTLAATVAWSYDLMPARQQRLLGRLSVFAGAFGAVEADLICGEPEGVVDMLLELREGHLIESVPGAGDGRFRMLETIRAFATERLDRDPEADETRRRHALAYLALAEAAAADLPGRNQLQWLDRLTAEQDNMRAAVRWAVEHDDANTALRFGGALWRFWQLRGLVEEGRTTIDAMLRMPGAEAPTRARVRALDAAGGLSWLTSDVEAADASYAAAYELAAAIGDSRGAADALLNLQWTRFALRRDDNELDRLRDQAVRLYEEVGDQRAVPRVRMTRAYALLRAGRTAEASELMLELYRQFGSGEDVYYAGLTAEALSGIALGGGQIGEALEWAILSLRTWLGMDDLARTTTGLRSAAILLLAAGRRPEAALLSGAFEALRRRYGLQPAINLEDWVPLGVRREDVATLLSDEAYADDAGHGASMTMAEAVDYFQDIVEGGPEATARAAPDGGEPEDRLDAVAVDAAAVDKVADGAPESAIAAADRFVREGDVWSITFDGRTMRLRDTKGLRYLGRLLASPGREIASIELVAERESTASSTRRSAMDADLSVVGTRPDSLLDATALQAYKGRLIELQEEIDEAERGDPDRAGRLQEEFDIILGELTAATGLGGRRRTIVGPAERARQSVTKAIHASLARIAETDGELGAHLRHAVRTGVMCSYTPDPRAGSRWFVR